MKSILVVDDNTFVAEALAEKLGLSIEGCRVATAANGAEAVRILDEQAVDLVLTDLQMPVMNGYELLEHCRKHHPRALLSAMTGDYSPETLARLCSLGVTVCFEKPFDFDEVAERIENMLLSDRSARGAVANRIAAAFVAFTRS